MVGYSLIILPSPDVIPANERNPKLLEKIAGELAVIVRHLMQRFQWPNDARELLQAQQSSGEAPIRWLTSAAT